MKGGTSDMLIEKTIKIKVLEEVWAGIEEKAKRENKSVEEYIKTLLEENYVGLFENVFSCLFCKTIKLYIFTKQYEKNE